MKFKLFTGLILLGWLGAPGAALATFSDETGYLGVALSRVPEALSSHIKGASGALIDTVVPGSPAEKAGLKRFDMIVSLNGKSMMSVEDVVDTIRRSKAGEKIEMGLIRGNESLKVEVILSSAPVELPEIQPMEPKEEKGEEKRPGFLGIGPAEVPPLLAFHLGLNEGKGVLVGDVLPDSPARKAGIERNDVLVAIDGYAIEGTADFMKLMSEKMAGDTVKFELIHRGEKKTIEVTLAERPRELTFPHLLEPEKDGFGIWGWGPRTFQKGRITIRRPDGSFESFPLPDTFWKAEDILKDMEKKFKDFRDNQIPELKDSLRESLRELEEKLKDNRSVNWSSSESHTSVIQTVEGDYDITLRNENGIQTVTVLEKGKLIAENLPYEKLDTLPKEVQDRIKKMADSIQVQIKVKGANKKLLPLEVEKGKTRA